MRSLGKVYSRHLLHSKTHVFPQCFLVCILSRVECPKFGHPVQSWDNYNLNFFTGRIILQKFEQIFSLGICSTLKWRFQYFRSMYTVQCSSSYKLCTKCVIQEFRTYGMLPQFLFVSCILVIRQRIGIKCPIGTVEGTC